MRTRSRRARRLTRALILLTCLLCPMFASAQTTYQVATEAALRAAIAAIDNGDRIVFTGNITLSQDLGAIQIGGVSIDGSGYTLSGASRYRGLFIGPPSGTSDGP